MRGCIVIQDFFSGTDFDSAFIEPKQTLSTNQPPSNLRKFERLGTKPASADYDDLASLQERFLKSFKMARQTIRH
jgi:hypothetical protein